MGSELLRNPRGQPTTRSRTGREEAVRNFLHPSAVKRTLGEALPTGITFMTRCRKIMALPSQPPVGECRTQRLGNARVNFTDRTEHDAALRIPFIGHLVRNRDKPRTRCLHGCWIHATNIAPLN